MMTVPLPSGVTAANAMFTGTGTSTKLMYRVRGRQLYTGMDSQRLRYLFRREGADQRHG